MMSACIPLHAQTPPSGAEREKASALHAAPHLKPHFSRPGSAYVLQMQPLAGVRETKVGRGRRWECMLCVCASYACVPNASPLSGSVAFLLTVTDYTWQTI